MPRDAVVCAVCCVVGGGHVPLVAVDTRTGHTGSAHGGPAVGVVGELVHDKPGCGGGEDAEAGVGGGAVAVVGAVGIDGVVPEVGHGTLNVAAARGTGAEPVDTRGDTPLVGWVAEGHNVGVLLLVVVGVGNSPDNDPPRGAEQNTHQLVELGADGLVTRQYWEQCDKNTRVVDGDTQPAAAVGGRYGEVVGTVVVLGGTAAVGTAGGDHHHKVVVVGNPREVGN